MHPLREIKKREKLTWEGMAEKIRKANRWKTRSLKVTLMLIAGGQKGVSPKMANGIHRAFPWASREKLIYYAARGSSKDNARKSA